MGPEEIIPSHRRPLDNETDIIHLAVIVAVNVEISRHLAPNGLDRILEQRVFPLCRLGFILVTSRVDRGMVFLVVIPGMGIGVGLYDGARRSGVEGGVDRQLVVGGLPIIIV